MADPLYIFKPADPDQSSWIRGLLYFWSGSELHVFENVNYRMFGILQQNW